MRGERLGVRLLLESLAQLTVHIYESLLAAGVAHDDHFPEKRGRSTLLLLEPCFWSSAK
jgi:hypothetical protein